MDNEFKELLTLLAKEFKEKLKLNTLPKVVFKDDPGNAEDLLGKTGHYDPNTKTITIYTHKRHPKDVLKTISHELVHFFQDVNGKLDSSSYQGEDYAQTNPSLRKSEQEAYLYGAMIFRDLTDRLKKERKK